MRTRDLAQTQFGLTILGSFAKFPIDLDPSLRDCYERIAARFGAMRLTSPAQTSEGVYYIHSSRPFFVTGR